MNTSKEIMLAEEKSPAPDPRAKAGWNQTFFLLLCIVFLAFMAYEWARSPLTSFYGRSLGASESFVGFIVGASTWTGVFLKFPAGALSDHWGRKRVILIGMVFFAFVPAAYRFATTPALLLAVRFLHGGATGIYSSVALAQVADLFKERRAEAMGWYTAAGQTGRALGPVGMAYVLSATGTNYATTYLVAGAIGLAALVLALFQRPTAPAISPEDSREPLGRRLKRALGDKPVIFTGVTEGMFMVAAGAVQTFLPIYAVEVRGLPTVTAAWLYSAQILTSFVTRPFTGMASDRWGRKPMIAAGMILGAAAFAIMPLTGSVPILFVLSALFGLATAVIHTSTNAYVADISNPNALGTSMGVFSSVRDIGQAVGPLIAGALLVAFHSNYMWSFGIVAAGVALFALLFPFMVPRFRDARTA